MGGIAPMRITSFVRHLPAFGWEPAVVTIGWTRGNSDWIDDSLRDPEIEGRVVLRTREPDLRRRGSKWPPLFRPAGFLADWRAALAQIRDRWKHGKRIDGSWFFIRAAEGFLADYLAANPVDLILATSPDLSAQRIASVASDRYGIPWVADCRDDYAVFKEGDPDYVKLESKLLATASAIVTISKGVADEIGKRMGRPVKVVENGYEPHEANGKVVESAPFDDDVFNMVFTGSVSLYYPDRHNPAMLFEAVAELFSLKEPPPEGEGRVAMHFFGDSRLQPIVDEFVEKHPRLRGVIRDRGRVDRSQALAAQRAADLLLLLAHPGRRGILTGKVFEYLAAKRPVLCLPGDGDELDALLTRTKVGAVPPNAEEGAAYLEECFEQWKKSGKVDYIFDREEVAKYSRQRLAGKLAGILDEVAASRPPSARG